MKNLLLVLVLALSINGFAQQKELVWHTDVNKATNISIQTGKPLFFFFTGSDWCGWCIKLQKAVFTKPEFTKWAKKNVVLVEFDFNRAFKMKQQQVQQEKATFSKKEKDMLQISRDLVVRGYPTVWLVTATITDKKLSFNRLGSLGARPLEVKGWISAANQILKTK